MRVISIDPGYDRCGVAVLEKDEQGKEQVLFSDCIETSKKDPLVKRLFVVGQKITSIIDTYSPNCMAIEELFFSRNAKTALDVGQALGVISYQAAVHHLDLYYFKPNQIKVAVTGYGKSQKREVYKMVSQLVQLQDKKYLDDEIDAIAVGLTLLASYQKY